MCPLKRSVTFAAALASTLAVPAVADGFTLTSPDIAEGQHVFLFIESLVTVTTLAVYFLEMLFFCEVSSIDRVVV
jgi:uncharacterized membrane protein required for colicin V production